MSARSRATLALLALTLPVGTMALAQEGTWSLSAVAGIALLQFGQVDQDGRNDIAVYRSLGIPIDDYPALQCAPLVQATAQYRFERDMSVAVFGQYQQARTATMFRDSLHFLSLDRRLTAVVFGTDITYYMPPLRGGIEAGLFVGLDYLWATADQITNESLTVKSGPLTEQRVIQDAYAKYKKSKLMVRAGGTLTVPFTSSTSLLAGVVYQHAPMGSMSGTLREYIPADGSFLVRPHDTTIEFDYSTLQLTLGMLYSF
jgi:hypothetical protein